MTTTELLEEWRRRVERIQLAHYTSTRRYERLHLLLGIPTIILTTVVGTSVFSTLSQTSTINSYGWMKIVIGLLSVASALLAALQTFLRYPELAEKHRIAGARFIGLKREIEMLNLEPSASHIALCKAMTNIRIRWMELQEESPNIPGGIWDRAKMLTPINEPEFGVQP